MLGVGYPTRSQSWAVPRGLTFMGRVGILWNSWGPGEEIICRNKFSISLFIFLIVLDYRCIKWSLGEESLCINNFHVIDNSYNVQTFIEFQVLLPNSCYNPLLPNYRISKRKGFIFRDFFIRYCTSQTSWEKTFILSKWKCLNFEYC